MKRDRDVSGQIRLEDILADQLAYYSARASEYDDWWLRRGSFDKGPQENEAWFRDVGEAVSLLRGVPLGVDVLELAAGTGIWSVYLDEPGRRLTLVDGSREMLGRNPVAKNGKARVEIADIFTWTTKQQFDAVVFAFWISHVPIDRLHGFFKSVASWMRDDARLFFIDDTPRAITEPHVGGISGQTMIRSLSDGSTTRIVKNFYSSEALVSVADSVGIDLEIHSTSRFFQLGIGRRRPSPSV